MLSSIYYQLNKGIPGCPRVPYNGHNLREREVGAALGRLAPKSQEHCCPKPEIEKAAGNDGGNRDEGAGHLRTGSLNLNPILRKRGRIQV